MDPTLSLTIRLALALLLATAAVAKLRQRLEFRGIVSDYQLLPSWLVVPLADGLPWLELAVAAAVLAGAKAGLLVTAALLAVYGLAMAINLLRGRRQIDCGCGGPAQQLSGWLLLRNVVLVAAALLAALTTDTREPLVADYLTAVAAVAALASLFVAAQQLLVQGPRLRLLVHGHE